MDMSEHYETRLEALINSMERTIDILRNDEYSKRIEHAIHELKNGLEDELLLNKRGYSE